MKIFIILLAFGLLTACNDIAITNAETEAVQKVIDFYGGVCNIHKGFESENGKTKTYFELEVSQSKLIEHYADMLELPASNIAYIFYKNLRKEIDKYSYIKVTINLSSGHNSEYNYSLYKLNEIEELSPIMQSISENVKTKDFEGILSHFDNDIALNLTPEKLNAYCTPYDSAFGKVLRTEFQGFRFFKDEKSKKSMVHIAGIMVRENDNTPLSLFIDINNGKVNTMKYKF